MTTDFEVHPYAAEWPLIEGDEFDALVADISEHGLREPVTVTHEGVLVDGRNRVRACEAAGVPVRSVKLAEGAPETEVLDLINSANAHRRHCSTAQLGFLGVSYKKRYAAAARSRESSRKQAAVGDNASRSGHSTSTLTSLPGGSEGASKSSERAAEAVGTSRATVERAQRVTDQDPELAEQVRDGQVSLKNADTQLRERNRARTRKLGVDEEWDASPEPEPAQPPQGGSTHRRQVVDRLMVHVMGLSGAIDAVGDLAIEVDTGTATEWREQIRQARAALANLEKNLERHTHE